MPIQQQLRLRSQVALFTGARTVLNTSLRMVYPFLPAIARGLGVELSALTTIITVRSGMGIFTPLLGTVGDRQGRKFGMLLGMAMFTGGLLLVSLWPTYPALFAALLLSFAGKLIFDPSMQAFLGDRISYRRRGAAVALTEVSWSAAYLVGVPVVGWLIARSGWNAPFPWLAALGLLSGIALWRALPADTPADADRPAFWQGLKSIISHPSAVAGLAVGGLISGSNELISIVYGAWMENAFGLQVTALGLATAIIGVAELAGEGGVAGLVDRLGKRRAVMLGTALNAVTAIALPLLGNAGLTAGLIGLFSFYLTFEFALVSSIPLMTELVPNARATMMSGNISALSAGRMLGALIGPWLFQWGMLANGIGVAVGNVLAVALLLFFVRVE